MHDGNEKLQNELSEHIEQKWFGNFGRCKIDLLGHIEGHHIRRRFEALNM